MVVGVVAVKVEPLPNWGLIGSAGVGFWVCGGSKM